MAIVLKAKAALRHVTWLQGWLFQKSAVLLLLIWSHSELSQLALMSQCYLCCSMGCNSKVREVGLPHSAAGSH